MSRLIDADKLLAELREYHPLSISSGILSDIEYFPTAYDVDKVCEELKFATRKGTLRACDFTGILGTEDYKGAFVSTQQAIEIVRRGGLND